MREYIMRDDSKALPTRMENIVRCRDCEHSMFETDERDSMLCFNEQWGDLGGRYVNADGSGFCAWGEVRVGE